MLPGGAFVPTHAHFWCELWPAHSGRRPAPRPAAPVVYFVQAI